MTERSAAYLTMKIAQQLFKKSPQGLAPEERKKVDSVALRQRELESLILGAPEAASVVRSEAAVASSLKEIRDRYSDEAEYFADLDNLGLDETRLREEIERELAVEAVLERIASRAAAVSATDVDIFFFMHQARFNRPEVRTLRHILVTINDALAGNDRQASQAKIESIRSRLLKDPKRFEEQAYKHSECPTAMDGGLLGKVARGQLYPELEPAAFSLEVGQISTVLESPMGFHVLRCDHIDAARTATLAEARDRIHQHLTDQRRQICQKSWINSLRRQG